jgi:hypothetical protein
MYGCPRTATVKATSAVQVWAMDRLTFHRNVMETTAQRREKYEKFLAQVPLFSTCHTSSPLPFSLPPSPPFPLPYPLSLQLK